jgi:hypothetical protein
MSLLECVLASTFGRHWLVGGWGGGGGKRWRSWWRGRTRFLSPVVLVGLFSHQFQWCGLGDGFRRGFGRDDWLFCGLYVRLALWMIVQNWFLSRYRRLAIMMYAVSKKSLGGMWPSERRGGATRVLSQNLCQTSAVHICGALRADGKVFKMKLPAKIIA